MKNIYLIGILLWLPFFKLWSQGPQVNLGADTLVCQGSSLILNAGTQGQTYLWQDGSSNPTLSVSSSGLYSVTVSNAQGTTIDSIRVDFLNLPQVIVSDTTVCQGLVNLTANGTWSYLDWWSAASAGTWLGEGNPLNFNLNRDSTIYVQGRTTGTGGFGRGGPLNNQFTTAQFLLRNNRGQIFDALQDLSLEAVWVYVQTTNGQQGSFTLSLQNAQGQVLRSRLVQVLPGYHRIPLNWRVTAGNGYRLLAGAKTANLQLSINSNAGSFYPWTIGQLLRITGDYTNTSAPFSIGNYNFFYRWEVLGDNGQCLGPRLPLRLTSLIPPSLSLPQDSLVCGSELNLDFSPNNTGANFLWSTGTSTAAIQLTQSGLVWVEANRGPCLVRDSMNLNLITPPNLLLRDTTVCSGSVRLEAGGQANAWLWWSAANGGRLLGLGQGLTWQANQDTTLYVEAWNFDGSFGRLGPLDGSGFGSQQFLVRNGRGLEFDVQQTCRLYALSIWAQSSGSGPVQALIQLQAPNGTLLRQQNLSLNNGSNEIILDWPLAQGLGYRLLAQNVTGGALLLGSGTGITYPYNLAGILSIRQDFPVFGNYNFFYDWKILTGSGVCTSSRQALQLSVTQTPSLNLPNDTLACTNPLNLDLGNAGATYLWSNGANTRQLSLNQAGSYALTISRGNCAISRAFDLRFHSPPSVALNDTSICGGLVSLTALGNAPLYAWWRDSLSSRPLAYGPSLSLDLWDSTRLFVSGLSAPNGVHRIGLTDNQSEGGAFLVRDGRGMVFDVYQDLRLYGLSLYADVNGTQLNLRLENAAGQLIRQQHLSLTLGRNEIILDWAIESGLGYRLIANQITGGQLYLNINLLNNSYPMGLAGVMELREDFPFFNNYNFFYDWKIAVGGYCSSPRLGADVAVLPTPRLTFPSDTAICGTNLLLDAAASGASVYLWSNGSSASSLSLNQSALVSLTASIGNCSSSRSIQASLSSPPSLVLLPEDTVLCGGLTRLGVGGNAFTYAWYQQAQGGTALFFGDTLSQILENSQTFWVEGLGFINDTRSYGLVQLGPATQGQFLNPTGTAYPIQGLEFEVLQVFRLESVRLHSQGAFSARLIIEDANGFEVYAQNIQFNQAGSHQVNLGVLLNLGSYRMVLSNIQGSGIYVRNNFSFPIVHNMLRIERGFPAVVPSRYAYFFDWRIATPSCPSVRDSFRVEVPPYPPISLPSDTSVCQSSSLSLLATTAPPAPFNYLWSDGSQQNQIQVNQSGRYAVTVSNQGCARSHEVLVQFLSPPPSQFSSDTSLCAPSLHLLGSADPSGVFSLWYADAGLQRIEHLGSPRLSLVQDTTRFYLQRAARMQTRLGPAQANPNTSRFNSFIVPNTFDLQEPAYLDSLAVYLEQAPAQFVLQIQDDQGQILHRKTVQVQQAQTKTFLPLNWPLKQGQNYQLSFDSIQNLRFLVDYGLSYPQTNAQSPARLTGTPLNNLIYPCFFDWHFSHAAGFCRNPDIDSFDAQIRLPLNLPDNLFSCDSLDIDANLSQGQTYLWSDGFTGPNRRLFQSGNYALTVSDNLGCQAQASFVFNQPLALELPADGPHCGDTLRSNYQANQGQFLWSDGSQNSYLLLQDTGWYQLQVINNNGCTLSDSVYLNAIVPRPQPNLGPNRLLCRGDSLHANYSAANLSYLWSSGETTASIIINQSANYALTLSLDNFSCQGSDSVQIQLRPNPQADFDFVRSGLALSLLNRSQNATTYRWDFGDGSQSISFNPFRLYQNAGCYEVRLFASNSCATDTVLRYISVGDSLNPCPLPSSLQGPYHSETVVFWPQPSRGWLSFIWPESLANQSFNWVLRDVQGRVIFQGLAQNQGQVLELSWPHRLSSNWYFLELRPKNRPEQSFYFKILHRED